MTGDIETKRLDLYKYLCKSQKQSLRIHSSLVDLRNIALVHSHKPYKMGKEKLLALGSIRHQKYNPKLSQRASTLNHIYFQ